MDSTESSVVGQVCPACDLAGAAVSFEQIGPVAGFEDLPRRLRCGGCGHEFDEDYRGA